MTPSEYGDESQAGPHDERHEEQLQAAFAAAMEGDPSQLAELRNACEACDMEAMKLDQLSQLLDDEAKLERAVRAAATESDDAPGAERVQPELERLVREERKRPAPRPRVLPRFTLLAVAGALAAGLLALVGQRFLTSDAPVRPEPRPDPMMLATPVALISPTGPVEDYLEFAWSYELPIGGAFYLRVYDADAGDSASPLLVVGPLTSTSFRPNQVQRGTLSASIRWKVEAFDLERTAVAVGEARANRR